MNYTTKTVYKIDSHGKMRQWTGEVQDDSWRSVAGVVDGKSVISGWRLSEAKNVGRSNETTAHDQAKLEADASLTKKLDSGYFADINLVGTSTKFDPMLAADYAKLKKPLVFPVRTQPKLDGIRCIANAGGLWSRNGKPHLAIPHIWEALEHLFIASPDLVLDGELYNHALKDDFNSIVSMVRKSKPTTEDIAVSKELVQYHVYDIGAPGVELAERQHRYARILQVTPECIQLVPNEFITSQQELDDDYDSLMSRGYEGQMIRLVGSNYENKRSKNLLKRKEFDTAEFRVLEIMEGEGNWAGCAKKIRVMMPDGVTESDAGCRGTMEQMRVLLNGDKPDWATVRYFGFTQDGKLRFGVMIDYGNDVRED